MIAWRLAHRLRLLGQSACRSGGEDGDRRREPVEEVTAADRPDLAGAEEAAGGGAERVLDGGGVVVGDVEHLRPRPLQVNISAPAAPRRPEPRPAGAAPRADPRRRWRRRGPATARSGRRGPARRATAPGSQSAPRIGRTRKSPRSYSGWFSSMTIPSINPCAASVLLARRQRRSPRAADRARAWRRAADHVAVGGGDRHLGTDRGRALRDAGDHADAAEHAADRAEASRDLAVEEERRAASDGGAREAAEHRHAGALFVERASSASALKLYGSASTISASASAARGPADAAERLGPVAERCPKRRSRSGVGSRGAQTTAPGPASNSRPAPSTRQRRSRSRPSARARCGSRAAPHRDGRDGGDRRR